MDVVAELLVYHIGILGPHHGKHMPNIPYGTINCSGEDLPLGGGEVDIAVLVVECQEDCYGILVIYE